MNCDCMSCMGRTSVHWRTSWIVLQPVFVADRIEYPFAWIFEGNRPIRCWPWWKRGTNAAVRTGSLPAGELEARFAKYAFILDNTRKLMDAGCAIGLCARAKSGWTGKTFTGSGEDDRALLENLALSGVGYRYGKRTKSASEKGMGRIWKWSGTWIFVLISS